MERIRQPTGSTPSIARRDFLNGVAISALAGWSAALAPRDAFALSASKSGQLWGGNDTATYAVAHALRDGAFTDVSAARDTGELHDVVIVGGGISGLTAAAAIDHIAPRKFKILLLENHPLPGGAAKTDLFEINGKRLLAPQGSIVTQVPTPGLATSEAASALLAELRPDAAAYEVPHMDRGFGVVRDDPESGASKLYRSLADAPIPADVRAGYFAFLEECAGLYADPNWPQKLAVLDGQSFAQYVTARGWSPAVYEWMVPELANFFGLPDRVSAAAVWRQYGGGPPRIRSFPGGNAALAAALLRSLWPESVREQKQANAQLGDLVDFDILQSAPGGKSLRLGATAVHVQHAGKPETADHVKVTYSRNGKLESVHGRAVIMAGGAFVTRHVVRDLSAAKADALGRFIYAPVVWANVALRNAAALDNADPPFMTILSGRRASLLVAYDKMNEAGWSTHRDPARPVVVGLSIPYFFPGEPARAQAVKGRQELLTAPFNLFETAIREDLTAILGPYGFDDNRDIAAISVSRWGHGYLLPDPGLLSGPERRQAAEPLGRIAYAHTDLDGFCHVTGAAGQGYRAAQDVLKILGYS